MGLFMVFILCLVAIMIMKSGEDALIENNYYEKGQAFDVDYNKKQLAIDNKVVPVINTNGLGATITFPVPVKYTVVCRRLSDADMDRTFEGYTDEDRSIKIQKGDLEPGPWLLRIEYTANAKSYLFEVEINML